ncbi:MAG: response regulator [Anditalea sp.]
MRKLDRILLVDDDPTTNFLNELLINEMGITNELIIALNGQEALDELIETCIRNNNCPNLILLDINMPVMNGFDFLKRFNELDFKNKHSIVVVMLTTSLNPRDNEKAKELKAKDHISKPLTKEGLKDILNKYFK